MEYQPCYGFEQVLPEESARHWINSYLRPGCKLVRGKSYRGSSTSVVEDDISYTRGRILDVNSLEDYRSVIFLFTAVKV